MNEQAHPSILLYDGTCNLCHWLVAFLSKRRFTKPVQYVPLQSTEGKSLLQLHQIEIQPTPESVIFISDKEIFQASDAVLELFRQMSGLYPVLYGFKIVPRQFRDLIYRFIAKNRYRWFGKQDNCQIP